MMAVDTDGNVFVTGQVAGTAPQTLMATWKYDSNGAPMWGTSTAPYEAYAPLPIQKLNYGAAVIPDGAGGCWAAGGVTKDGEGLNIAVIHYDSNGNILSPTPFIWNNHLQNGDDYPVVVAMDGASNVWVGGVSSGSGTGADFFVIGFDSLTGTVLGYDRYDGPSNKTDLLVDMKVYSVASSGSGGGGSGVGLSVVGTSFDNTTKNDAVILHYTWNGLTLARTTNSPIRYTNGGGASNEVATAMEVWFNGSDIDTFVSGSSDAWVNSVDLKKNYMLLFNYSRAAQVFAATPFDGNGGDDVACKVDVSISRAAPLFDTWVYITGTSWQSTTNWNDVVTRAYRIDRTFVWSQEVPGAFDDRAVDMVAVPGGDLYVLTGRFNGANFDYRTVSYDISDPDGAPYWTNPPVYDAPNGGIEAPASIKYVITNDILLPDIHVSGRSQGLFDTNIKYATVKYVQ